MQCHELMAKIENNLQDRLRNIILKGQNVLCYKFEAIYNLIKLYINNLLQEMNYLR